MAAPLPVAPKGLQILVANADLSWGTKLKPEMLQSQFATLEPPAQALTLESIAGRFTPPSANPANAPNEYQKNHTQWPGPGNVGSDDGGRM